MLFFILYALRGQSYSWSKRDRVLPNSNQTRLWQFHCFRLAIFLCFGLIFKIPLDWLQWVQITCVQFRETDSWLRSGSSLGVFASHRSVTTPLYEGLREVGNGTRVALALILKLSLAQRKLQAPIVTSWLHRFILMRETVLILQPSWAMTKLPGLTCMRAVVNWASVACLANSRTPADFFCFVFFHIILTEPLETFKSLCSVCCGFWTKGRHKKGYHCAFSVLLWSRSTLFLHLLTVQAAQFYARARRRGPAIYLANHLIYGN